MNRYTVILIALAIILFFILWYDFAYAEFNIVESTILDLQEMNYYDGKNLV